MPNKLSNALPNTSSAYGRYYWALSAIKTLLSPARLPCICLRSELHLSFPKIARELGRKDHTTAIHSVEKIEKEFSFDSDIKAAITEIKERLYA